MGVLDRTRKAIMYQSYMGFLDGLGLISDFPIYAVSHMSSYPLPV